MTSSYSLDVELFICEVQKYPEIWNNNSEDNRFKSKRQQAWNEIARVFIDDFDGMPNVDKLDVYRKLQSKWRNIRDNYVRHKRRKYGKKGYLYAKHLTFLKDQYKDSQSGSDVEAEQAADGEDPWPSDDDTKLKDILYKSGFEPKGEPHMWHNDDDNPSLDSMKRKRKVSQRQVEFVESNFAEQTCSYTSEDDDKSFFDSLLPVVRQFDIDQKLEFRSDVIQLIKEIRKRERSLRLRDESD